MPKKLILSIIYPSPVLLAYEQIFVSIFCVSNYGSLVWMNEQRMAQQTASFICMQHHERTRLTEEISKRTVVVLGTPYSHYHLFFVDAICGGVVLSRQVHLARARGVRPIKVAIKRDPMSKIFSASCKLQLVLVQ